MKCKGDEFCSKPLKKFGYEKIASLLLLTMPLLWCLSCEKDKINPRVSIYEKEFPFMGMKKRTHEIGEFIPALPGVRIWGYANFDWSAWTEDGWLAVEVSNPSKWGLQLPGSIRSKRIGAMSPDLPGCILAEAGMNILPSKYISFPVRLWN